MEQLGNGGNGSIEQTTLHYYGPNAAPESLDGGDGTSLTKKEAWNGTGSSGTKTAQTDYAYNEQGRLEQVSIDEGANGVERVEEYVYTDDGIRVQTIVTEGQTVVTTDYVIDPNNPTGYAQVLEEWTAGATPNLARSFVIGHSILSQWTDQTSQVLFLLADGHGSTQMLVDAAGAIQQSYDYDAYGNLINPPANPLTSHLYTGEQLDARTGQYYLRARYYDSATGRFATLDPFGGVFGEPQTLHRYAYCSNAPIAAKDPSGRETFTMCEQMTTVSLIYIMEPVVVATPVITVGWAEVFLGVTFLTLFAFITLDNSGDITQFVNEHATANRPIEEGELAVLEKQMKSGYPELDDFDVSLHYSFLDQAKSLLGGLWPKSWGTKDCYRTGWEAHYYLALKQARIQDAVYVVVTQGANKPTLFGPALSARDDAGNWLAGGGEEWFYAIGTPKGSVFAPIPIPEGEKPAI